MRTPLITLSLIAGLITSSSFAQSPAVVAADASIESQLCVSAATNPSHVFKQDVQQQRLQLSMLANKLQCNGQAVAQFARQFGNEQVAKQLGRYVQGHVDIEVISSTATPKAAKVSGAVSPN